MATEHPITPPLELVRQWFLGAKAMPVNQWVTDVATQAARWGADQELEACCEWVKSFADFGDLLHAERRPKPLSLKEQALAFCNDYIDPDGIIRRALEALPDS